LRLSIGVGITHQLQIIVLDNSRDQFRPHSIDNPYENVDAPRFLYAQMEQDSSDHSVHSAAITNFRF
jgi:hypothetical protein